MPGQTLSEIRQLLAAAGLSPLHRFGQNFLIDLNLMRKLVEAAGVTAGDVVLEVGPGTGSLTECLLDRGAAVVAVEVDRGLQELVAARLADQSRFELVRGDALGSKHELSADVLRVLGSRCAASDGFKLVANLPYQIATPLLVNLMRLAAPRLTLVACTLQREVAARLTAPPGSPAYGPVSVIARTFGRVESIARLPPEVFWPRPQVESEMLLVRPHDPGAPALDGEFVRFVRECFAHRRQTLRRILSRASPTPSELLDRAGLSASARPEELSPADWRRLHQARLSRP